MIQRILLHHIVETREERAFTEDMVPMLFIIEEATALMRGKSSQQLDLFAEVQVKCRKYGIGMGLIFQDIMRLDTTLLTQLGWMITMGMPADSSRNFLFKNVPSDLNVYNDFIKYADVGYGIGYQKNIANYSPLPVVVNHYEEKVKMYLENNFDLSKENIKNLIRTKLSEHNVPDSVIKELFKPIEKKKEDEKSE
ncbi:MAG: hypothetical protein ACFFG0_30845 [Candidatus Thorarchaeota archaeon]